MNNKFYVGELYDGDIGRLKNWLDWMSGAYTGSGADPTPGTNHTPAVFDFNMRFAYKDLSDNGNNYDIRNWNSKGLMNNNVPYERIVTFVENHDFDRNNYQGIPALGDHNPVINHKMECYAHMLMSPGLASVWWRDFFYYNLQEKITDLVRIRRTYASGNHYTLTAFTDGSGQFQAPFWPGNSGEDPKHLYVLQRVGDNDGTGVILVINKHSSFSIDVWVTSQKWAGLQLYDITGNDPDITTVQNDGRVFFSTAASSYSVYVPLSFTLNFPLESGHFPNKNLGYSDGNHPHGYTTAPNYRQNSGNLIEPSSTIFHNLDADLYSVFRFDTFGKNIYLIYTTDGSTPTKSNGNIVNCSFSKFENPKRYWYGTIPASANQIGTLVKYVFYISNSSLANSFGRIAGDSGLNMQYQTTWNEGDNYFSYPVDSFFPVELNSFTYKVSGNSVILNWQTVSEVNNFGFEIERKVISNQSSVFSKWSMIGFVKGHGNSNSIKDYRFIDEKISSGKYLYRLKQIDTDGKFEYNNSVEVNFFIPSELKLEQNYPNPFNPATKIKYTVPESGLPEQHVSLKIFDILGNEIAALVNEKQEPGNYEIDFNAGNYKLSSGIYYYQLKTVNEKIVKKMSLIK
jgi:hypothetical protein